MEHVLSFYEGESSITMKVVILSLAQRGISSENMSTSVKKCTGIMFDVGHILRA